ncbi:MAG: amidase [Candidatus Dormibacteraeota bacterium]|uniref:Amidase n=1 Tax=Candidatus Dormiibacter inghamiae TaxID=3127013 RepID=A0A934KIH1_9BACT|nr:amidase [Candidatus Dormibacteraeota bacterium]MBJ7606510.1 amidase [Candidatus Dormibacteraeota bacterium]
MQISQARSRAEAMRDLNIFISMTDEDGDGEVVAVKDLVDVRGTPTLGGGGLLPSQPKEDDAPLIANLRRHGCVVIGKTNLHEWAFGSTNINHRFGTVRNPRDPVRIAGGSSGGSAAAVAAGVCDWAVGTDTGGSVRIPAGLCGVVGFKPTYGTVDTSGVVPLSHSLDTVGSLANDVATASRAVAMMAGTDDWGAVPALTQARLRLAVPALWVQDLDTGTQRAWDVISHGLPQIEFPALHAMQKACLDIMYPEAAAFHREWIRTRPQDYSPDVLSRLHTAFGVSGADYIDALTNRRRMQAEVARAMRGLDAILLPTCASVAPLISDSVETAPLVRFGRPFNLTGQPVFTLPAPVEGLPVGIQVIGHLGRDIELSAVAAALEQIWRSY